MRDIATLGLCALAFGGMILGLIALTLVIDRRAQASDEQQQ